jgi:hypothetical protein
MADKHAVMQVTKKVGFVQVGLTDRGTLTEREADTVMQAALESFGNFSEFRDPLETREIRVTFYPDVISRHVEDAVDFSHEVDFRPVTNRVPTTD